MHFLPINSLEALWDLRKPCHPLTPLSSGQWSLDKASLAHDPHGWDTLPHTSGLVRPATSMRCHTLLQVETPAGKLTLVGAGAWLSLRATRNLGDKVLTVLEVWQTGGGACLDLQLCLTVWRSTSHWAGLGPWVGTSNPGTRPSAVWVWLLNC